MLTTTLGGDRLAWRVPILGSSAAVTSPESTPIEYV
jgi:hypothetical protein